MTNRLDGKVTFITGTGGQQGRAAALLFAGEGAKVVGCDLNAETSKETTKMVTDAGGEMVSMDPVDLADAASVDAWIELGLDAYGKMDVLYNNASAARMSPIDVMPFDDWAFTIRNELDLIFVTTKAAWPHLVESHGVIINTASIAGLRGTLSGVDTAHAATKGAVHAMTRELCAQGAPHGIRAVSISPGIIIPEAMLAMIDSMAAQQAPEGTPDMGAAIREMLSRVPAGRPGTGEDIAKVALFLASDEASYVNGTDIVVDGGQTAVI
jgi:meso-butanediol dehydrogenase / (S,S)-butanediol dehydrogenase / diacetyl reductase